MTHSHSPMGSRTTTRSRPLPMGPRLICNWPRHKERCKEMVVVVRDLKSTSFPVTPHGDRTGVPTPSKAMRIIEHAQLTLEISHRQNQSMLCGLLAPLRHYVDQGDVDVVRCLAMAIEENERLVAANQRLCT